MSKKQRRAKRQQAHHEASVSDKRNTRQKNNSGNLIDLGTYQQRNKQVTIIPRSKKQEEYLLALEDQAQYLVFSMGPAGCGKTLLATLVAIKSLIEGTVEKIVITRPAVSVDEDHGFLPGTLEEKMMPWVMPIFDVFKEYFSQPEITAMVENGVIEIAPLAYMRGRTFKNAFIIADEMQNSTPSQTKMVLTRIGEGSRILMTGDLKQHDRGYENNGLKDFLDRLQTKDSEHISVIEFSQKDVKRHPVISEILNLYGDE